MKHHHPAKRCEYLDLSKHEFSYTHIPKTGCMRTDVDIYKFAKPGTYCESFTFINAEGIMTVTGDWGNWVFCREFIPSPAGYASGSYWVEKAMNSSKQQKIIDYWLRAIMDAFDEICRRMDEGVIPEIPDAE